MDNGIEHIGVVGKVGNNDITVMFQSTGSCGCCPAASMCNAKENTTNTIVIPTVSPEDYLPGEKIKVIISTGSQRQAIIKGVVVPCLILLITITCIYILSVNELYAAFSGLIVSALYYSFLYLKRDKIMNRLKIKTEKVGAEQYK